MLSPLFPCCRSLLCAARAGAGSTRSWPSILSSFLSSCALLISCALPTMCASGTKKLVKFSCQPAPASPEPEYPTALVTTCAPPGTKKLVKFPRKLAQLPPQEATVGGEGQWGWCGVVGGRAGGLRQQQSAGAATKQPVPRPWSSCIGA